MIGDQLLANDKKLRITFYSFWIITLSLQSYMLELRGDEAYYWRYSLDLAWGYFDHPPVVAFLTKVGYFFFPNELGVRLLFVLLITGTLWVTEKLIKPSNLKLYYSLALSIAFLQLGMVFGGGMFALPDFPLLFFTALFLYFFKDYLEGDDSWRVIIWLSFTICLLILSKYHGVLIVGFAVLANLTLLKKRSFWIIFALSVTFLLPHIHWQFENDFPSMRFHFFERSTKAYSFAYTWEYLATFPFILGPFVSVMLIYVGFIFRAQNGFERSLKFIIVGTYLFFFLMTFKGAVEGNWTIITLTPLLYAGYRHIEKSERLRKVSLYLFMVSFPVILLVRLALIADPLPTVFPLSQFFGAKKWALELKERFGGIPVAFINSYQKSSLFQFYSGLPGFPINDTMYRKNQFTIWDTEAVFQGKTMAMIANYSQSGFDTVLVAGQYYPYTIIENFRSSSNLVIESNLTGPVKIKAGDTLNILVNFKYRNGNVRDLGANPKYAPQVMYSYAQFAIALIETPTGFLITNDMINNNRQYPIKVVAPTTPGVYDFYLSAGTVWFYPGVNPGINSNNVRFMVE